MNRSPLRPLAVRVADAHAEAARIVAARRGFAPGMTMHGNAVLNRLEQERQGCLDFIDRVLGEVETAGRDLVQAERDNLKAQKERIAQLDDQIKPLREFEELREADAVGASRYTPSGGGTSEPGNTVSLGSAQVREREYKYRSVGEFLADTYKASPSAQRNGQQLDRSVADGAAERLRSHGLTVEGGALMRASAPHNTTAEVPGLIPTPIVGEIISNVDGARPFITSVGPRDLGGIPGLSFERPIITQHVQVGKQAGEKTEVANRQFIVSGVPFTKDTYGGWANVSRQSIDWTAPGVWDALMSDFIEQYGLETEDDAADAFATSVVQTQQLGTATTIAAATMQEVLTALYAAAGKTYAGSGRLPDTIWASLDWWGVLGPLMDGLAATTAGNGGGSSAVNSFAGNLLNVNRVVVPSFPNETLIVGTKNRVEVYEDRFGFLSVVEPKVFGVEIAYGGYMATGTLKASAFCKIIKKAA